MRQHGTAGVIGGFEVSMECFIPGRFIAFQNGSPFHNAADCVHENVDLSMPVMRLLDEGVD